MTQLHSRSSKPCSRLQRPLCFEGTWPRGIQSETTRCGPCCCRCHADTGCSASCVSAAAAGQQSKKKNRCCQKLPQDATRIKPEVPPAPPCDAVLLQAQALLDGAHVPCSNTTAGTTATAEPPVTAARGGSCKWEQLHCQCQHVTHWADVYQGSPWVP